MISRNNWGSFVNSFNSSDEPRITVWSFESTFTNSSSKERVVDAAGGGGGRVPAAAATGATTAGSDGPSRSIGSSSPVPSNISMVVFCCILKVPDGSDGESGTSMSEW